MDAANRSDAERLLELSHADIEVVGPRGSGFGHQLLVAWLSRAGLTVDTLRAFVRGDSVVVEQHGVWRSIDTGEVTGERDLASRFRVEGGKVMQFQRYDTLDAALGDAGLDYADDVQRND